MTVVQTPDISLDDAGTLANDLSREINSPRNA